MACHANRKPTAALKLRIPKGVISQITSITSVPLHGTVVPL
jgi:hypothetical protein